jgi:hypothetical protein
MKKLLFVLLLAISLPGMLNAITTSSKKDVIGEWKFEAPSAPYGYEKGTVLISEKEGNLVGEIKFEDGYKIALKKLELKDNNFNFGLYVDYEYISVKTKITDSIMKGLANTPNGDLEFKAVKK